jgi:hypothetical protein
MRCWMYISRVLVVFVVIVCLVTVFSGIGSAHDPENVSIAYNIESGVLSVNVVHNSEDITLHSIKGVLIFINGVEASENESRLFDWDENEQGLVASYNVSAGLGDEIVVEVFCTEGGMNSASLVVGASSDDSGSSTPGFEIGVVFVAGLLFCIGTKRVIRRS